MVNQMRPIEEIILHCSDSPDERDIGVKEITEWHKQRGFRTCGYHYVIRRDGTVEPGRDEYWVGAHVEGHNQFTIGICWIGRDSMAPEQKIALIKLVKRVMGKYKLTPANVKGHYEYNKGKTCPNIKMDDFRRLLA